MTDREIAESVSADLPLIMARNAIAKTSDAACLRGWDELVARFGSDTAARAWRQACREYDAHGAKDA